MGLRHPVYDLYQSGTSLVTYEWVMSIWISHEWVMSIWISHVTYERVMSHVNESRHIWMSHVTYCKWVMSHMNELCHIWRSQVTCEWVMSLMNEPYYTWRSHVTYERAMSHLNALGHIWSHVICDWLAHLYVTWLILSFTRDMTHVRHEYVDHVTYERVFLLVRQGSWREISFQQEKIFQSEKSF